MKEATKKVQITEQICKQIKLMRKGGANQTEIGKLLGINPCTVSRLESSGFDLKTYQENRKARREKEQARKQEQEEPKAEEQIPGQMEMDLTPKPAEMSDQVKMMRFIAGQVDKLYMKMETINDTMSQILRAIRKE